MRSLILSTLLLTLTACPGRLEDPDRFLINAETCVEYTELVMQERCSAATCHTTVNPAGELDLQSPRIGERLVGVEAPGCGGTIVDPDDPFESIIYRKLLGTPPCGAQMPGAGEVLSEAEANCFLDWIVAQGPDGLPDPDASE